MPVSILGWFQSLIREGTAQWSELENGNESTYQRNAPKLITKLMLLEIQLWFFDNLGMFRTLFSLPSQLVYWYNCKAYPQEADANREKWIGQKYCGLGQHQYDNPLRQSGNYIPPALILKESRLHLRDTNIQVWPGRSPFLFEINVFIRSDLNVNSCAFYILHILAELMTKPDVQVLYTVYFRCILYFMCGINQKY